MPLSDQKIFFLNTVELCVVIFRGPNTARWDAIYRTGVPELLDCVQHYSAAVQAGLESLAHHLDDCARSEGGFDDLESEFVRLFIAGPGGTPAPLYESCHLESKPRTMGQSALDMRDRLAEAGLAVDLDSNEPPDNLTLELEYLYHLLATGWSGNEPDMVASGMDFAATVMLPWVRRFHRALCEAEPHPVFRSAADIVLTILETLPES